MKFQTAIFVAALFAAADATPRRLRKGELRRTQAEDTPAVEKGNEVGAEAEEVMVKAKSLKSMSMDGGSPRVVDAKAGEFRVYWCIGQQQHILCMQLFTFVFFTCHFISYQMRNIHIRRESAQYESF